MATQRATTISRLAHPGQGGGTFLGLILGVVIGLGVALVVALYVTKVPVPFVDRGIMGRADDAEQTQKNKDWNPNAAFNQNTPLPGSEEQEATAPTSPLTDEVGTASPNQASAAPGGNDPLGHLIQQKTESGTPSEVATAPTASLPIPAIRQAGQVQELVFYVQAGAFSQVGDADRQRAKLALLGVDTRVSQDTVNDRMVYRVRSGPYKTRGKALETRQRLTDQNIESVVVAVAN